MFYILSLYSDMIWSNCRNFCPFFQGFLERAKIGVHNLVQRVGFFGILACASVSFEKHYNLFISTLININPHKTFNSQKT